jgi:hypothetical protein
MTLGTKVSPSSSHLWGPFSYSSFRLVTEERRTTSHAMISMASRPEVLGYGAQMSLDIW